MIRTLIEVTAEDRWGYEEELRTALDKLGFERKADPETVAWHCHLAAALRDKGLEPDDLVQDYRRRHAQPAV